MPTASTCPNCPLCAANSGQYDFKRDCCRLRFLLAEPRLSVRRAWLARWEKAGPITALRAELMRRWPDSRSNSDSRCRPR